MQGTMGSKDMPMAAATKPASFAWRRLVNRRPSRRPSGSSASPPVCSRGITAMASPTIAAPKRQKDPKKRIVITGMGLVSVFGNDVDVFYDHLLQGSNGVNFIDRFDTSDLAVKFAAQIPSFCSEGLIDRKSDRRLDYCWKYGIVAGKKALDCANLGPQQLRNPHNQYRFGLAEHPDRPYGSKLLHLHRLRYLQLLLIRRRKPHQKREVDVMLASGTEAPILPIGLVGFKHVEPSPSVTPNRERPPGHGTSPGMGDGELGACKQEGANIIAEYLGGAITCDAHHVTDPRSDGLGVISCITKSLENAGVSQEEVNYINAHATSTPAGDLAEVNAIKKVFRDTSQIKMNATKSMIGHCLGAAGGLEAIATIKAINSGWVHPTINQYNLEPEVSIDTVPNVKQQHEIHVAISNSFGFGGQNAVVVFAPFVP
ncbi:hypothetical protein HPP92_008180 [Vanilla planifolia]|uniref:beta-ketoacyl-[acyl-carrier-protein] synthase I n=1 Tax=Vanilla planifolia TaxID=51239 RepID=A0A835V6K9_VANPL|nr:hypothetical protein HPP92_008180 [Vanilla planifolia]